MRRLPRDEAAVSSGVCFACLCEYHDEFIRIYWPLH